MLSFPDFFEKHKSFYKGRRKPGEQKYYNKTFLYYMFLKTCDSRDDIYEEAQKAFDLARKSIRDVGAGSAPELNTSLLEDLKAGRGAAIKAAVLHYYLEKNYPWLGKRVAEYIAGKSPDKNEGSALRDPMAELFDPVDDLSGYDHRDRFYIYEAAFLWHELKPPFKNLHMLYMPQEVEETKRMLHDAWQLELFRAFPDRKGTDQTGMVASRNDLAQFAENAGMRPRFLFPDNPQTQAELMESRKMLSRVISERIKETLRPVANWGDHDKKDSWPLYQIAFLWHGFEPPPVRFFERAMTSETEEARDVLRSAVHDGSLAATISSDGRFWIVGKEDLKAFAEKIGSRPRFLFGA